MEITPEIQGRLDGAAQLYEQATEELEKAAAHARRAAEHFRNGEVPRGTAHAWAARGHLLVAGQPLDEQALAHRLQARV